MGTFIIQNPREDSGAVSGALSRGRRAGGAEPGAPSQLTYQSRTLTWLQYIQLQHLHLMLDHWHRKHF
jgi:hypothetical protein